MIDCTVCIAETMSQLFPRGAAEAAAHLSLATCRRHGVTAAIEALCERHRDELEAGDERALTAEQPS